MEHSQNADGTGVPVSHKNPMEVSAVSPHLFKPFMPFPMAHTLYDFTAVKWYWAPGFRFDLLFMLKMVMALSIFMSAIFAIFIPSIAGKYTLFFVFLFLIPSVLGWLHTNIAWNQTLRTNICHTMAKSNQAKAIWKPETSHERLLGKDKFHEESGWGYSIFVLRDSSVEIHSSRSETVEDIVTGMAEYSASKLGGISNIDGFFVRKLFLHLHREKTGPFSQLIRQVMRLDL